MRRRVLLGALGSGLLAACSGSGGSQAPGQLRIATGSPGAVYFKYGTAISRLAKRYLPHVSATVLQTSASAINVQMVLAGTAELGFTQADIAGAGYETAPGQLAALARLYDDYVHLVTLRDSGIQSVADLLGKRVSVGAPGSGTAVTAERLLSVAASALSPTIHRRELNLDDSVAALRARTIDAFFFSGGLPVASIADLAKVLPIQLVELQEYVEPLRKRYGNYYAERVVPTSTYTGTSATVAIGIPNYLVVRMSMAESLAYGVTRLLFDGRDELTKAHQAAGRLNVRSAISTPPLPLHVGAERYYREQKG